MLERFLLAGAIAFSLSWFVPIDSQPHRGPVSEEPAPQAVSYRP